MVILELCFILWRQRYVLTNWSKLNEESVKIFKLFVQEIIPLVIPIGQENVCLSHYYFDHGDQKINFKIITPNMSHTYHQQQNILYDTHTHTPIIIKFFP